MGSGFKWVWKEKKNSLEVPKNYKENRKTTNDQGNRGHTKDDRRLCRQMIRETNREDHKQDTSIEAEMEATTVSSIYHRQKTKRRKMGREQGGYHKKRGHIISQSERGMLNALMRSEAITYHCETNLSFPSKIHFDVSWCCKIKWLYFGANSRFCTYGRVGVLHRSSKHPLISFTTTLQHFQTCCKLSSPGSHFTSFTFISNFILINLNT